jgi:hypothetical protein
MAMGGTMHKNKLFLIRPDGLSMFSCLSECINNKDFIKEFDRLSGTNLSMQGNPIDIMVDEHSGRLESDFNELIEFVHEYIFKLCPDVEKETK